MNNINATTNNFWRTNLKWRTTLTGMNQNVTREYNHSIAHTRIIKDIRTTITPYIGKRYYIPEGKYNEYFTAIVNDCLDTIRHGERGFVYSTGQLREVMMVIPDVNVRYDKEDDCYYCKLI
ncbi:MAG: hypothetical protein K0S18_162 [Anaerocolumna sp.]|jgi:hypothetical protein|nr:hypothetical protein [Anaerocolumna sp.]